LYRSGKYYIVLTDARQGKYYIFYIFDTIYRINKMIFVLKDGKGMKKAAGFENRDQWPAGIIPARRERVHKEEMCFMSLCAEQGN
jgi:hypothetical protein